MTEVDGESNAYRDRKSRTVIYRRAISGRKDSRALGLLQKGYVIASKQERDGKVSEVYSITDDGVKALLKVQLKDYLEEYLNRLIRFKGVDEIVRLSRTTGYIRLN